MPAKKRHVPSLGSVSHGTLRTQDLLNAFADTLAWHRPRGNAKLVSEARAVAECIESDKPVPRRIDGADCVPADMLGSELVNELADKLTEIAPDYVIFGANDGDGSDFGFWPLHDRIAELPELPSLDAARKDRVEGDFRIGDCAVYRRHGNGRITLLLSV